MIFDESKKCLEFFSPLSPVECQSRLSAAIDKERWPTFSVLGFFGSKPVQGWVTESSLRLRKRIRYNNSGQIFFTGTMRQYGRGTLITGSFAEHPFVRVSTALWFGGMTLGGGILFIATIGEMLFSHPRHGEWLGIVVPPVMLIFGSGLVKFCRFLARHEPEFLTDFIMTTLDGESISKHPID